MSKIKKISSTILLLSTLSTGGVFYYENLSGQYTLTQDYKAHGESISTYDLPYLTSSNFSIVIVDISFNEDNSFNLKYVIKSINGGLPEESIYNASLTIFEAGATSLDQRVQTFNLVDDSYLTTGQQTIENIKIEDDLFEAGKSYDAYITWNEKSEDAGSKFASNPTTFSSPSLEWPEYQMSVQTGHSNAIVKFDVDYSNDSIARWDIEEIFKYLHFNLFEMDSDASIGEAYVGSLFDSLDETSEYQSSENFAWTWDMTDTKTTFYSLLKLDPTKDYQSTYSAIYNASNFSTSQIVTNDSVDELTGATNRTNIISLGKDYSSRPDVAWQTRTEEEPVTEDDFARVYFDFSFVAPESWKEMEEQIDSVVQDGYKSELFLTNAVESISLDNFYCEGEFDSEVESVSLESGEFDRNTYGNSEEINGTLIINGLNIDKDYTADLTIKYADIFQAGDTKTVEVNFSTLSALPTPTIEYLGAEDPETYDDTLPDNWTRNNLKFNLNPPASFPNISEIISADELYDSGTITFTNKVGDDVVEESFGSEVIDKIVYGENSLNTKSLLSDVLNSQDQYSFKLELLYSDKAKNYFELEDGATEIVEGENVFTKNKVESPSLQIISSDSVAGDRTKYKFNIGLIDSTGRFTNGLGSALSTSEVYENLYLSIKDETDNEVYTGQIPASELVLGVDGGNEFVISGLDLEKTYNYEIGVNFNEEAINEETGWISGYEDDILVGEFVTDDKFQPYPVIASVSDIRQNDLDGDWSAKYTLKTLKGSETERGFDNELINQDTKYSVTSSDGLYSDSGDINFASSDSKVVLDEEDVAWYEYDFEVKDLPADTIFTLETTTTFDDTIVSDIYDTPINFMTNDNEMFTDEDFIVSWNDENISNPEVNNYYQGLEANIKLNNINEYTEKKIDGIKSITLWENRNSTPVGVVYDSENNFSIENTSVSIEIPEPFYPGEFITDSQYYFTIETYDDYESIDNHFELPEYSFAYLSKSSITQTITDIQPTTATFEFDVTNYNNIESIVLRIFEVDGDMVYTETVDDLFDVDEEGSTKITLTLDELTLDPNTTYENEYTIQYKNVVGTPRTETDILTGVSDDGTYKTPSKLQSFDSEYTLTQDSTHSIELGYSYQGYVSTLNDPEYSKVESVELSLKDAATNEEIVMEDALSDFDPASGTGTYPITNKSFITTRHTYQLYEKVDYNLGKDGVTNNPKVLVGEITITSKSGGFTSEISYSQKNQNSISIKADYNNFITSESDPELTSVEYVKYEIYSGTSTAGDLLAEDVKTEDDLSSGEPSGTWGWTINDNPDLIKPELQYTIATSVKYEHDYNYDGVDYSSDKVWSLGTDTITLGYDDSEISLDIESTGETTATIDLEIENPKGFEHDSDMLIVSLKNSNREVMPVLVETVFDSETKYIKATLDEKYISISDLEPYLDFYNEDNDTNVYSFDLYGVYLEYGDTATLQVEYNANTFTKGYAQSESPKLNPNSMVVQKRYEYDSSEYLYEIKIKHSSNVNLQEDVRIATYSSSQGLTDSNKNMLIVGKEYATEESGIDFDANNLYLLVDSGTAKKDWRDLSFLVGNYFIVSSGETRTIDYATESIYGINDFDMLPLPKEPLTFFQVILIILLVLLFLLILWVVIYKLLKYNDTNKWYEFAKRKADYYYNYHVAQIEAYGWTHRYNDWQALSNMTIPQLREYSKKMNIPLPYKLKKDEMIEILSLLNAAELAKVKEFTEHIIEVPQKIKDDLLYEFQNSHDTKPKAPRRKFNYIVDKAERMQEQGEEFKKTFKDYIVDWYIIFDKYFIEWTDFILIKLGWMEPKEIVEDEIKVDEQENNIEGEAIITDDVIEVEETPVEEIEVKTEEVIVEVDIEDDDPETTNAHDVDSITVPKNRKGGGS